MRFESRTYCEILVEANNGEVTERVKKYKETYLLSLAGYVSWESIWESGQRKSL